MENNAFIKKYPFEVKCEQNDGLQYYVVHFPDFEDVDGAGKTIEEAIEAGYDALQAMIDYMIEENIPLPAPSVSSPEEEVSGRVTLRMPKSLHRKLNRRAEKEGTSLNTIIVTALAEYLKETKKNANIEYVLSEFLSDVSAKSKHLVEDGETTFEEISAFGTKNLPESQSRKARA